MFLGIVFSKNLFEMNKMLTLIVGAASFTAIAGATYIFNDISDIEEDRAHPRKQHRPIASGDLPVSIAAVVAGFLVVGGLTAAYWVGTLFFGMLIIYIAQNVLYSLYLKRVALVDVLVIAFGFVLRAIAGVFAIDAKLSPWLIVSTFLLALVLALGKRRGEIENVENINQTRPALRVYMRGSIDNLLLITMSSLLMAYSLYTFSGTSSMMMLTIPCAFFGVFRYHYLLESKNIAGKPEYLLTDPQTILNMLIWVALSIIVLYEVPQLILSYLV
ncbi:UbiA prenyltransferase family protein [Haloarchaeobius sp. HME9146]|uniref:UbiA prenyltransferase family protein n=1 Tax=Haloarchaeobius sp. HME9146 TaxID=2978732 RepID=UPI0021BE6971|nr:UbiA prenyltransferase family protein [Haloarchaeobius sp. HME9146]MCT9097025.1 UbiA prenyltransferase family protein [Haloarchaeobius sp. HME9146]